MEEGVKDVDNKLRVAEDASSENVQLHQASRRREFIVSGSRADGCAGGNKSMGWGIGLSAASHKTVCARFSERHLCHPGEGIKWES